MPGREGMLAAIWCLVFSEINVRGAKNVSAACKRIMREGQEGGPRTIVFNNEAGERVYTILTWRALRDFYNKAERARQEGAPTSFIAQRCAAISRNVDQRRALHQSERAGVNALEHLKRRATFGGQPIQSDELHELFPR